MSGTLARIVSGHIPALEPHHPCNYLLFSYSCVVLYWRILAIVFFFSQYNKVVDDCTAALELDPHYVKALLRRTQANENLEKFDLALAGQ